MRLQWLGACSADEDPPKVRMAPRLQLRLDSRGTMAAVSSLQDCVSPARPSTRTSAVMAPGQSRCRVDGMGGPLVDWMSSNRTVISVSFRLYVLYYTGQFSSVAIRVELKRNLTDCLKSLLNLHTHASADYIKIEIIWVT